MFNLRNNPLFSLPTSGAVSVGAARSVRVGCSLGKSRRTGGFNMGMSSSGRSVTTVDSFGMGGTARAMAFGLATGGVNTTGVSMGVAGNR